MDTNEHGWGKTLMRSSLADITIASGDNIVLRQVLISFTYSGLIMGEICPEVNELALNSFKVPVCGLWHHLPHTLLNAATLQRRTKDKLPEMMLIGHFRTAIFDKQTMEASDFIGVWLQDQIDPILSPDNLECLKAINLQEILKSRPEVHPRKPKTWLQKFLGR